MDEFSNILINGIRDATEKMLEETLETKDEKPKPKPKRRTDFEIDEMRRKMKRVMRAFKALNKYLQRS